MSASIKSEESKNDKIITTSCDGSETSAQELANPESAITANAPIKVETITHEQQYNVWNQQCLIFEGSAQKQQKQ
jgi:hypothetical protein